MKTRNIRLTASAQSEIVNEATTFSYSRGREKTLWPEKKVNFSRPLSLSPSLSYVTQIHNGAIEVVYANAISIGDRGRPAPPRPAPCAGPPAVHTPGQGAEARNGNCHWTTSSAYLGPFSPSSSSCRYLFSFAWRSSRVQTRLSRSPKGLTFLRKRGE